MTFCIEGKCCVFDMTDEEVRELKKRGASGGGIFVTFVLRAYAAENKLVSMKSVVPPSEFFEAMKAKIAATKTAKGSAGVATIAVRTHSHRCQVKIRIPGI